MEQTLSRRASLATGGLVQRRGALVLLGLTASTLLAVSVLRGSRIGTEARDASEAGDAPTGGDAAGDVSVVTFFDYNCSECKAAAPELQRFCATEQGARLVYRDWPLLGAASREAARLALAARYQDRYEDAYHALMATRGRPKSTPQLFEVLGNAGLDIDRLTLDATDRAGEIEAQLARNAALGTELRLRGVPGYLIGGQRVTSGFDIETVKEVVARARTRR